MSRGISRHTWKCLEIAFLVTVVNLLVSLSVVQWYSSSGSSSDVAAALNQDSRLLLSVEYPDASLAHTASLASETPRDSSSVQTAALEASETPSDKASDTNSDKHGDNNVPTADNISINLTQGVFDKFRMFKSHMFSVTGDQWSQLSMSRVLCLGAQTSVDRLYELVELVTNWSGPLSISVFVPHVELAIGLKYIQYLKMCNSAIDKQVSFHLVYPVDHPGIVDVEFDELVGKLDCAQPRQVLQYLMNTRDEAMMNWRVSYPYPQNLLRNLAKNGCQTNYTYVPDIDMVPTPGMDLQLETFLRQDQINNNCTKCAFVIPTYEIAKEVSSLPQNKTDLLKLVGEKKARQFHQALYSINQKSSNLQKWEKIPETDNLEVAYKVEKYIFKYEPLYVARGDTPPFDERFIGFGMTRNTQVYEMYVAGYNFYLLNNIFTSHWGFQTFSSRPVWRAKQMESNNAKFDEFAKEVSAHYDADPYNMLSQLKKMNLKHVKVAYKSSKNKKD